MLYNILAIGKSGLNAMQTKLDITANNVANIDTIGYKKKNTSFNELLTNKIHNEEVILSENAERVGINAGTKSKVETTNYKQGPLSATSNKFDMAIEGNGFFGLKNVSGELLLTRNGQFHMNKDNTISDSNGYLLDIEYIYDPDKWISSKINISKLGKITTVDENDNTILLGNVKLYYPDVLDQLIPIDSNFYIPSNNVNLYNSIDNPEYFGNILQSMVEKSNVDLSDSMVDLIVAQKSYAMNARVISTTDEVIDIVNSIKR